jgi:hypothetical protein
VTDFLVQRYIFTAKVYYNSFGEQLSMTQINTIVVNKDNSFFFVSIIEVVLLFIKCLCMAAVLQCGLYLRRIEINFDDILKIAVIGEFIFLVPQIIKFLWFYYSKETYTVDDLKTFFPLSVLNFFDDQKISLLWYYPLKTINIFEVMYWFVLAFLISPLLKKNFNSSLNIVLSSYLPALLVWISFIMFLVVTLNPA